VLQENKGPQENKGRLDCGVSLATRELKASQVFKVQQENKEPPENKEL